MYCPLLRKKTKLFTTFSSSFSEISKRFITSMMGAADQISMLVDKLNSSQHYTLVFLYLHISRKDKCSRELKSQYKFSFSNCSVVRMYIFYILDIKDIKRKKKRSNYLISRSKSKAHTSLLLGNMIENVIKLRLLPSAFLINLYEI